jgi:IS30 family transposase
MSKSSIYRNLHRGFLSISPVDLPRAVKFKTRHKRREQYVPKAMKAGRSYEDFLDFIDRGNVSAWMEMDTLIGRVGGKTIMTFHFTFCNFMPAFLLPDKTAAAVRDQVLRLKRRFSDSEVRFGDIVPLVLTDNGGEFSDIFSLENDLAGRKETDLFFCDPMRSDQKAKIEKNHTLFRDIVPKGSSFDHFSQDTVDLIASHVNSVKRKLFNGKTPYEMFSYTFGDEIPKLFGVRPISAKDVLQSPKLLQSAEAVSTFSAQPPITL